MSRRSTKKEYLVIDIDNEIVASAPMLGGALNRAQRLAERAEEPVSFLVDLDTVIGRPETLYRVERDKSGVVFTRPLGHPKKGS